MSPLPAALRRSLLNSVQMAREWLKNARNSTGGFGYLPAQPTRGEPSLLATAAGMSLDPAEVSGVTDWSLLLLPLCLRYTPGTLELRERVAMEILSRSGRLVDADLGHDAQIPGWSWYPETANWLEPTAYAVLSLCSLGQGGHERVGQGLALIQDRQCEDGGWNYGNPRALGAQLESFPDPTGWALLALHPMRLEARDSVDRGLQRVKANLNQPSTRALSMGLLALVAYEQPFEGWVEALMARQESDGGFTGRCDRTALAVLALEGALNGTHPLVVN